MCSKMVGSGYHPWRLKMLQQGMRLTVKPQLLVWQTINGAEN
jgi:hypothetical protein